MFANGALLTAIHRDYPPFLPHVIELLVSDVDVAVAPVIHFGHKQNPRVAQSGDPHQNGHLPPGVDQRSAEA